MNFILRLFKPKIVKVPFVSSDKYIVNTEIKLFYTNSKYKCDVAIIQFIVDAILFALSLVGLKIENEDRLTRAVIRELGQDTLNGIGRIIIDFNEASSALKKSKELFKILKIIYDAGVFKDVKDIVKDEMTTWQWFKSGMFIFAQVISWFGTDGVAFTAECVLIIMSTDDLIEDGCNVKKVCAR
jgi:hypothetical protein